jgi:hypothetical protein
MFLRLGVGTNWAGPAQPRKLAYVSSAALRVIIQAGKVLQGNRGEIGICNARGGVGMFSRFLICHSLTKIYDTEKEAFACVSCLTRLHPGHRAQSPVTISTIILAVVVLASAAMLVPPLWTALIEK